jgi:hypothetical protein
MLKMQPNLVEPKMIGVRWFIFSRTVFCDDDVICEVQTLEHMMDENFTSDMSEEEVGE